MSIHNSIEVQQKCKTYIRKVSYVTEMLKGKWKIPILCAMRSEPVRLSQLTRLIPSASKKALRASLRSLEAAEIVVRRDLSGIVLQVEYDFADDMRATVCSLLDQLANGARLFKAKTRFPDPSAYERASHSLNSVERID